MHEMRALFDDKAYEDIMNGKAMFKKGFRSVKGNYHPNQPEFVPVNEREEALKDARLKMRIETEETLLHEVALPFLIIGLWNAWENRGKVKVWWATAKSKLKSVKEAHMETPEDVKEPAEDVFEPDEENAGADNGQKENVTTEIVDFSEYLKCVNSDI